MRRRRSPYSCIEEVRRSRTEVLALILITVILGLVLGLLTEGLADMLRAALATHWRRLAVALAGLLTLGLTAVVIWLFHARAESQRACIDLWIPYHFPGSRRATIACGSAYMPPRHARAAFMHRYPRGSQELQTFTQSLADARAQDQLFQDFIADDQRALTQCLALYVLHRYGDASLGAEAPYGWWGVDLEARRLSMDDLSPPLRHNPFLRADQRPDEWRLLLPEKVTFRATESRWVLRHLRFGQVIIRWFPHLAVAARRSQPYQALTTRMHLSQDSQLYVVGTRIEAIAHLHWTLLPASEPFHRWATGLLARLEEALDFEYYIATRPDRIIRDLEWKIGWMPEGRCVVEMLQTIEGRLEDLEMETAAAALEADRHQGRKARGEEEGESFVV